MRKIAVAVLFLLTVTVLLSAACSPTKKAPAGEPTNTPPQKIESAMPVQGSAAHPEMPVSTGHGETSTTMPSGTAVPGSAAPTSSSAQWPKEVPMMPGLQGVTTNTAGMIMINASGKVKPADIEKFYSSLQGWIRKKEAAPTKDNKIIAFTMEKAGATLTVTITDEKGTSRVQFMYMPKR